MPKNKNLRLETAALKLLLQQSHLAYLAVFLNSVIYVVLSWDVVNQPMLLIWFSLSCTVTLCRFYWQKSWESQQLTFTEIHKLNFQFRIGVVISGTLWGVIGGLFLVPSSSMHLGTSIFIIAGMTAGAVGAYSISFLNTCLYIYPCLIPLIFRLFFAGNTDFFFMGIMGTFYLIIMTLISKNVNRTAVQSLNLGLENEDLVNKLNNASHEIRTPLTAISGFAELLTFESSSDPKVQAYAKIILRNSLYLKKLVENILLLSAAEAAPQQNDKEVLSLKDEIELTTQIVSTRISEKNLTLKVIYAADIPDYILSNSTKFQQILVNLIGNAVKFTQKGGIVVSIESRGQSLVVEVTDSGLGMGQDAKERIFQPFYRENRQEIRKQEGSGLGLALSKNIAQSLGGNLRLVKSEIGKGSVFELELPFHLPPNSQKTQQQDTVQNTELLKGRKILIVDDSLDILDLFKVKFEAEGASVNVCSNGDQAVSCVANSAKPFDLVLMDISMPEMDGFKATELIRKAGYTKPVLAFTAYSAIEKEKYFLAGFNEKISKSMDPKQLVTIVASWMS